MATKKQLVDRWKLAPWSEQVAKINAFCMGLRHGHSHSADQIFIGLEGLPYSGEVSPLVDMRGAMFSGCIQMSFDRTSFSYATSLGHFIQCNLSRCVFDNINATGIIFSSTLTGASFCRSKLRRCNFSKSDCSSVAFSDSVLDGANFEGCNLSNAVFDGASCKQASFHGANLSGCSFKNANLTEAVFQNCIVDDNTDFTNANKSKIYNKDLYDNFGNIVARATDLSITKG